MSHMFFNLSTKETKSGISASTGHPMGKVPLNHKLHLSLYLVHLLRIAPLFHPSPCLFFAITSVPRQWAGRRRLKTFYGGRRNTISVPQPTVLLSRNICHSACLLALALASPESSTSKLTRQNLPGSSSYPHVKNRTRNSLGSSVTIRPLFLGIPSSLSSPAGNANSNTASHTLFSPHRILLRIIITDLCA